MTLLVRGVRWPADRPILTLTDVESSAPSSLDLGGDLQFRVVGGPGDKYCTGYRGVDGAPVPCAQRSLAVTGGQCDVCAGRDPFRFVHIVHRQDFTSKSIEAVVMQPHWLYVATFGAGAHKIGTAADPRKWGRLTEQGALVARYVAYAPDGRVVRELEDAMTETVGLRQAVRASAKAASLTMPIDLAALDRANKVAADHAREHLSDLGTNFEIRDEQWDPPTDRRALFRGQRLAYPLDLTVGDHGFVVEECVGSSAFVRVPTDPDTRYVADLTRLSGRRIEFGTFASRLPPVQPALF